MGENFSYYLISQMSCIVLMGDIMFLNNINKISKHKSYWSLITLIDYLFIYWRLRDHLGITGGLLVPINSKTFQISIFSKISLNLFCKRNKYHYIGREDPADNSICVQATLGMDVFCDLQVRNIDFDSD